MHELGHLLGEIGGDVRGEPETPYSELSDEEQYLWSNEEEYINITQVENVHRESLNVAKRKFHSGDPLIFKTHQDLMFLVKNREEYNPFIILWVNQGKEDLLLTSIEVLEFQRMAELFKKNDERNTKETLALRWMARRHIKKLEKLRKLKAPNGSGNYEKRKRDSGVLLTSNPGWQKKIIPNIIW